MLPVAILAGGLAMRLRPLTDRVPKSLIPINGEPFIVHQLRMMRSRGVERVVLCVGHLGAMIREVVDDGEAFGLEVDYSWDGPMLLGTGGAIRMALPLLGEAFLVMYGDSYLPCDYRAVERAFAASGKMALMTIFHNNGKWDSSNVEFSGDRIVAYDKHHRTPRMHYIDYGLGAFNRRAFDALPFSACDLATVYQDLLNQDELAVFEVQDRFYEAGSLEGIRSLSELLAGNEG